MYVLIYNLRNNLRIDLRSKPRNHLRNTHFATAFANDFANICLTNKEAMTKTVAERRSAHAPTPACIDERHHDEFHGEVHAECIDGRHINICIYIYICILM